MDGSDPKFLQSAKFVEKFFSENVQLGMPWFLFDDPGFEVNLFQSIFVAFVTTEIVPKRKNFYPGVVTTVPRLVMQTAQCMFLFGLPQIRLVNWRTACRAFSFILFSLSSPTIYCTTDQHCEMVIPACDFL